MKAQQAIELMILIGIIMTLGILIIIIVTRQNSEIDRNNSMRSLEVAANNINQEIKNVISSPTYIIRDMNIMNFDGNISIQNGTSIVLENRNGPYILFLDYFLNGNPCIGSNKISKYHNILSLCCNCIDYEITLPQNIMCLSEPFLWKDCHSIENITRVNSFIAQCPNATDVAEFNITNGTNQLIFENSTLNADNWFFIDVDLNISNTAANIKCINATGVTGTQIWS
jgi:hypothetical protein